MFPNDPTLWAQDSHCPSWHIRNLKLRLVRKAWHTYINMAWHGMKGFLGGMTKDNSWLTLLTLLQEVLQVEALDLPRHADYGSHGMVGKSTISNFIQHKTSNVNTSNQHKTSNAPQIHLTLNLFMQLTWASHVSDMGIFMPSMNQIP